MKRYFFLIAVLGFAGSSLADVLVLKNGDRLTGTFVRITDGKLAFKADLAGDVTVGLDDVRTFETVEPIEVHLKDGTVIQSRARQDQPGRLALEATDILKAQSFVFADIAAVNPPSRPKVKWAGNVTAGLTSTHGNTFSENGSMSFKATRRSEKDRTNIFGRYMVSRTKETDALTGKEDKVTTEESFITGGKYDYFFSKKLYSYISGNFKKDHIADLDSRIITGVGCGYQWIESDKMNFSSDLGLSILCEQYTTHGKTTRSDELAVQMGYNFDKELYKGINFFHNIVYYPSVTGSVSDYYLTTDAEVRIALNRSMFGSFKAILDYDSTPAENVGGTDTKYILGVGWSF
jgi:putative salt-induced outer membrane protein YdiY